MRLSRLATTYGILYDWARLERDGSMANVGLTYFLQGLAISKDRQPNTRLCKSVPATLSI